MVSRRLQKRIEAEAAEKVESSKPKKKATRAKTTTRAKKVKAPERKRLLWGVFSGTLKEEGRYPYDQRDKAEERLEQLRAKSKKMFFIQPIKEVISDESAPPSDDVSAPVVEEELEMENDTDTEDDGGEEE